MRKTLFGLVIGVGAASLAFILLESSPERDEFTEATFEAPVEIGVVEEATPESLLPESVSSSSTQAPAILRESEIDREARLRREIDEAQIASDQASAALEQLLLDREFASDSAISPEPLPPGFDWVYENSGRAAFRDRFQREPIDAEWASRREMQLLDFIYSRPEFSRNYGAPTVRCHSTRCEVTLAGAAVGETVFDDVRSLHVDFMLHISEPLPPCGPDECWSSTNIDGGVATIFWSIGWRDRQTQSQLVAAETR